MRQWTVALSGAPFDLADLEGLHPEVRVSAQNGKYRLESDLLDALDDPDVAASKARELVCLLNGVGMLHSQSWEPVAVAGLSSKGADGSTHVYLSTGVCRGRSKTTGRFTVKRADGTIDAADPTPAMLDTALALRHQTVSKALRLLGQFGPTWGNLYRIHELVEKSLPRNGLSKLGWATSSELNLFTHTANHPAGAGDDARHTVRKEAPPTTPMTLEAAHELILRILRAWTSSLRQRSS